MTESRTPGQAPVSASKRTFIMRTTPAVLSASAVALIAGCESMAGSHSSERMTDDVAVLNFALGLEHEAIGAYQVAAGSGLLGAGALDAATVFLGHHLEHRDTLASVVAKMGGQPVEAKSNADYAAKLNLGSLKSEAEVLELARELERQAANAYIGAVPKFGNSDLALAAARISADEVMHFTVLNGVLVGSLPKEAMTFAA
ncbi:MAG: hypothetical protein TEF_07025 [Rhizobiales bacterium NRL2]|jgi:hypothetical protein|nr:MAG: hypothetical protein TEF_07025 [Rhizobiales bacterium NRL2]